jgi:hypothetical protein
MEIAIAARMQASSHGASAHLWKSRYGGAIMHGGTADCARRAATSTWWPSSCRAAMPSSRRGMPCSLHYGRPVHSETRTTLNGDNKRAKEVHEKGTRGRTSRRDAVRWQGPRDVRCRRSTGSPGSSCELNCIGVAGPHGRQAAPRIRSCMRATGSAERQ